MTVEILIRDPSFVTAENPDGIRKAVYATLDDAIEQVAMDEHVGYYTGHEVHEDGAKRQVKTRVDAVKKRLKDEDDLVARGGQPARGA